MLTETATFNEKTPADLISPEHNSPIEPHAQDWQAHHEPAAYCQPIGGMEAPTSWTCRDRGRGGVDEGALCLSSSEIDPSASREANVAYSDEDRHKAPSRPLIHPLSLQDGNGASIPSFGKQDSSGSRLHTFKQILRFGLAGGLNTLVDLLILNGLLWLFPTRSSDMLLAYNSLAYSVGAINSFLLNKYWTFGQRRRTTRAEVARFALVALCGIAWSSIILWLASRALHPLLFNTAVWANASKLVAIGGTALISYLGMRLWVFVSKQSKKKTTQNVAASAPQNDSYAVRLWPASTSQEAITEQGAGHPGAYKNARGSSHSLSVVLPAYNEEQIIANTISVVLDTLSAWRLDYEIIVVNDGSTDGTEAIVAALAKADPRVRLITHPINQGYGAALVSGFAAATKELTLFMDSDGQFDIRDLAALLPYIDEYAAVIGCRLHRQDSWMRRLNAWGWKCLIGLVLDVHVRDIDCAFKLLRTGILHQHPLETRGAMINAELLYRLQRAGCSYREVGVQHLPRRGGRATGAKPSVIARAFRELFIYGRRWRREEREKTRPLRISERHSF